MKMNFIYQLALWKFDLPRYLLRICMMGFLFMGASGFGGVWAQKPGEIDHAYRLSWAHKFEAANIAFDKILTLDPDNFEAKKGKAYVALWSGHAAEAARMFLALLEENGSEELLQALAFARLAEGDLREARFVLDEVHDVQRKKEVERAIRAAEAKWEAWVWGGMTTFGSQNSWGPRAAMLSWHPHVNGSIWARVDNSLAMDNAAFLFRDTVGTAYFLGGNIKTSDRMTHKLELGRRLLEEQGAQWLIQYDQVWFFQPKAALKSGVFMNKGEGTRPDMMIFAGVNWELGSSNWLEPTIYLSWKGLDWMDQYRFALHLKHKFMPGQELSIGGVIGKQFYITSPQPPQALNIWGGWLQAQQPIFKKHWLYALARYESTPSTSFLSTAIGVRFRFE